MQVFFRILYIFGYHKKRAPRGMTVYIEGKYREGDHLRDLNYRGIFSEGSKK